LANTIYNNFQFPEENEDPHFEKIASFFNSQDFLVFNNKLRSNFILAGGGTKSFSASTGLFSWTDNFALKIYQSGWILEYVYGPDGSNRAANVQPGQVIFGAFPASLSINQTRNLSVTDKLGPKNDLFVLGWRYKDNLYLADGSVL
jgi:hypothetical protein